MLSPTVAGPRPDLTRVALGHITGPSDIVRRVLPTVIADKPSGRFFKIAKGAMLGAQDGRRAPGAKYQRDNLAVEADTFLTETKGLEGQVPDEQAAEYAGVLDLEQARTTQKTLQIMRRERREMFELLFSRTTFPVATASGHDCTNEFDDHSNATPVDEFLRATNQIRTNIGDWREMGLQVCALMSLTTRKHLALCSQVRSGLGGIYTRPDFAGADVSDAVLAAALGVDELVYEGGVYMSGGTQVSPTNTSLASDEFCLIFVRLNPNAPELAGLGATFVWDGFGGELDVKMYREDQTTSGVVQVDRSSVFKIVQSGAGYLIGNCAS